MKKIFSVLLALAMFLSLSMPILASDSVTTPTVTEDQIDENLRLRGYPQLLLDNMCLSAKESLYYDSELIFYSGTITTYNEETGEFNDYYLSNDGIMPCGQIDSDDLTLSWAYSFAPSNPLRISVRYSYTWNNVPFARWQDPISVSWDPTIYEMVTNSFYKVDMYDGSKLVAGIQVPTTGEIHSSDTGYANASPSGVTWYADLRGYWITGTATKLYGYGEFTLQEKNLDQGGWTTIYGHYVHQTGLGAISVNVDEYGSFSVSGGTGYDERGNQHDIPY